MLQNKKNSLWLTIQFVSSIIFSLITLKLNLLNFGEEVFGIWILLVAFWGVTTVIDFGYGTAIIKYIAEAKDKNKPNEINEITSTVFIIFLTVGLALFIFSNLFVYFIYMSNNSIIPENKLQLFKLVFIILGVSFYFQYLSIFFRSLFEGLNNFVITSKLTLSYNFIILIAVIVTYIFNLEIWVLALFYSTASLILLVFYFIFTKKKCQSIKISVRFFSIQRAKSMFGFSFSIQISTLLGALIDPVIKFIIGNYGSASIISYYEVARRFSIAISGLFNTAFKTILPRTSILKSRNEYKNYILTEGIKYSKLGIIYSGLAFGIVSIFIIILIKLWFGFEQSIIIFFLLSLAESVNNTGFMVYTFFMGIGRGIYLVIIQLTNIIMVIIFLVAGFLIFKNQIGLIGYFISVLIMNLFMLILLKRETSIDIISYLKNIKVYKLFMLLLLILFEIILNYSYSINIYLLSSIVSILCVIIFYGDIKNYIMQNKDIINILKTN